jgi:hypothetical protein
VRALEELRGSSSEINQQIRLSGNAKKIDKKKTFFAKLQFFKGSLMQANCFRRQ